MSTVGRFAQGRRYLSWVAVAAAALVLLDPQMAKADPGVPVPPNELIPDRGKGVVSAADRDFLVKVRLAGLWEIPAGDMAQDKSDSERIRSIGKDIAAQHVVLDKLVRDAAKKLDVELPDKPNSDQQSWLAEMRDADGRDFDQIYIDRLRAAHGKIFPAIATIRASTRNDTVRKLAQRANQFVATHMTLLESSGIVDFAALPTAPPPAPATSTRATQLASGPQSSTSSGIGAPLLALVVGIGLAVGLLATRMLLPQRAQRRRRRHRYYADGA